ncbi:SUKH-3 domain-containing protein [Actinophytocola xinjiangensis]|nr:SUKH-3 domain-containing protein [Actinophytocola xinjiangensis]
MPKSYSATLQKLCIMGTRWMMTERLAVRALLEANWSPDRRVDIVEDLNAFRIDGFPVFPVVVDFLQRYSGIVIHFDRAGYRDVLSFSGKGAGGAIEADRVEIYSRRAGVLLAPVGEAYGGHLILMIGEDGSWYGGYDNEFGSLGGNFLDALENLILVEGFVQRL